MIENILNNFVRLLFPHLCLACMEKSIDRSQILCIKCLIEIPYTDHFIDQENKVIEHFYGRIPIKHGAALLYFNKGSLVQVMMHNFKYKGEIIIGTSLGKEIGRKITTSPYFNDIDLIIPMPIYEGKRRKRGFNQTEIIAEGIQQVTKLRYRKDILVKLYDTETQTNKDRTSRMLNVKDSIGMHHKELIKGKNILLVDDIITTGATAEVSGRILLNNGAKSISVVTAGAATTNFL